MADVDPEQAKASMFRAAARAASALGRPADEAELTARAEDVERERVTALWREAAAALESGDYYYDHESGRYVYAPDRSAVDTCAACGRLREQLDALAKAATEYQEAVRLAGSYPGHEEYVQAEFVEIQGRLDDADMALDDRLAAARAALGVEGEQEKSDE